MRWVFVVLLLWMGCTGEEGPAGLVGPQGEQGPPGENASFTVSDITLRADDFVPSTSGKDFMATFAVPAITQDIVNGGLLIAFFEAYPGMWFPMPYDKHISGNVAVLSYGYATGTAYVLITQEEVGSYLSFFDGYRVRFVTAAPGAGAASLRGVET